MFQLPQFRETNLDVLHAFIRAHSLGLLISYQNRAVADRAGVADGLAELGNAASMAMREMVKDRGGV